MLQSGQTPPPLRAQSGAAAWRAEKFAENGAATGRAPRGIARRRPVAGRERKDAMENRRRAGRIRALLAPCLAVLLACGCGAPAAAPEATAAPGTAAQATPEPDAVVLLPAATPEPTATPAPDPLAGGWTAAEGGFVLTLAADGSFLAERGGGSASGRYTAGAETLTLEPDGLPAYAVGYALDGDALYLEQDGQTALPLVREGAAEAGDALAATGGAAAGPAETTDPAAEPGETDPAATEPAAQATPDPATPVIACAYARRGVVRVELAEGAAAAYAFTVVETQPAADSPDWADAGGARRFSAFKSDGDYFLWVRGEDGSVSEPYPVAVRSGYRYVLRAEGLEALTEPLDGFLEAQGSSVDALNAAIAEDVADAGLYTRCGVVTAAVSLVSRLAEYGVSAPYQGRGAYQDEEDWGVNPDWGARLRTPTTDGNGTYYYTGMQCVASIVWAYKQAGVNLSNGAAGSAIGTCGEREKRGDNEIAFDEGQSGDIVQNGGHYLMIVDRLDTDGDGADDSYLTYEMNAPHLAFLVLTFRQVRYRTFFSMNAVFENAGRLRDRAHFWEDTFYIPDTAFPAYLTEAAAGSGARRALDRLLAALGLPLEAAS